MLNFAVNVAEMLKEATIPVCLFHESHSNICALQYMTTECLEINWLCKQMKKVRISQASIIINLCKSKISVFPVSIVKQFNTLGPFD